MAKPNLSIIICDDDKFMLETSVGLARKCAKDNGFNAAVVCALSDYNEVFKYLEKNPGIYLFFLDIDFGKSRLNGVDLARMIKRSQPLSKIVFVTNHGDMGMDILRSGVEAFGFIEKSTQEQRMLNGYKRYIGLALDSGAVHEDDFGEATISLLVGIDEYITVPVSHILFAESDKAVSHFVRYHTIDGSSVSVRDTIENALERLGDGFMKSHRSVVINKSHVISVEDGLVKFGSGETAACSFRLKGEVIRQCKVR
jgi:DNA-binding LytR/AlgR family response regulator